MTISTTPSEKSYQGDNVSTEFAIPFVFGTSADLKVIRTDSDGNISQLITGWSTTGGNGSTGTLTLTSPLASGHTLTIIDDPERSQTTSYVSNDAFPAQVQEGGLDKLTRLIKRLHQRLERTFRTADGDPASGDDMVFPTVLARRGKFAYWSDDSTAKLEPAVGLPVGTPLSQSVIGDLLFPYDGDIVNGTLTATATARFYAAEEIADHAHYAFLDNSLIEYAGDAPIYGHASFNANVTLRGSVDSDHHNGFQAYPHIELDDDTVTIDDVAGFFSRGDLVSGSVSEWAHFRVEEPTNASGNGDISNHYGYFCAELDLASGNNYAFFSLGRTKSCFGGDVQLGNPTTPATIKYDYDSGNLQLIPRTGFVTHVRSELLLGTGDAGTAASIENTGSGELEITSRSGFPIKMMSPTQVSHPLKLPAYTVAQLGSAVAASSWTDCICICSNETGGRTLVFSNGTNWKRVQDLANVS